MPILNDPTPPTEQDERRIATDDWQDLAYDAWCVIANSGAFGGSPSEGFGEAAVRWRDRYHQMLKEARQ